MIQPRSAQPAGVKGFFAAENYTVLQNARCGAVH